MYAYCDNNPVNNSDPSGSMMVADRRYLFGYGGGSLGSAVGFLSALFATFGFTTIVKDTYQATQALAKAKAKTKEKEEEKAVAIPSRPNNQAYFTVNPYDFAPRGLIMTEYPGTKNGRIIECRDPVSHAKIFEWDEDFKYGAHYHAMLIEWDGNHRGIHYLPGTPVPEPWNTLYFGD